jgi:hypothetical protein
VSVYLRLQLTCFLLSAICCWGFVYLEFSWAHAPFVFSSIQSYPPFAIAVFFYLEFTWGGAPPPLSSGACHTLATVGSLSLTKCTGGVMHSCLLRLARLFTVPWGSAPSPLSRAQGTPSSLLRAFFFSAACLLFSLVFLSFFPGWGSVCPGGYADLSQGCLWEYHMPLSSPGGLLLPSQLGASNWWRRSPPGFSI